MKIINIILTIIIILVIMIMIPSFLDKIDESRLKENHCLEEERYYYRIEGGLFSHKIETIEGNHDGIDYKCIKWEEELELGKAILGQNLIHNKSNLKTSHEANSEKK